MSAENVRIEQRHEAQELIEEASVEDDISEAHAIIKKRPKHSEKHVILRKGALVEGRKAPKEERKPRTALEEESDKKERISTRINRVLTGIPGLDGEIEGGYIENSVNLVAGSPGAGKTIFAMQFLMEGLKNNESVLFISFEETKEKTFKYMAKFGWDLEKYEDQKRFFFLRYSPQQVYSLLEEGGGLIDNIIQQFNIKRLAIDSITAFTLLYKDELAVREALLALFEMLAKWKCTTLLTAEQESNPTHHVPNVVEFETDGVVLLYNFRTERNTRQRVVEVLKMRGTNFTQRIFPMKIEEEGIVFHPDETAF